MKNIVILSVIGLLLCGCAAQGKRCFQQDIKKSYAPSNESLKSDLANDLTGGKVPLGATLDEIRSSYGQPDDMLVASCTVRIIYRRDRDKNITLWFDDGWHLSMWNN
jgi:hypothetical protein